MQLCNKIANKSFDRIAFFAIECIDIFFESLNPSGNFTYYSSDFKGYKSTLLRENVFSSTGINEVKTLKKLDKSGNYRSLSFLSFHRRCFQGGMK